MSKTAFALAVTLAGLALSSFTETSASIADTNILDNEVASSVNETANSGSAVITITMYTLPGD